MKTFTITFGRNVTLAIKAEWLSIDRNSNLIFYEKQDGKQAEIVYAIRGGLWEKVYEVS